MRALIAMRRIYYLRLRAVVRARAHVIFGRLHGAIYVAKVFNYTL